MTASWCDYCHCFFNKKRNQFNNKLKNIFLIRQLIFSFHYVTFSLSSKIFLPPAILNNVCIFNNLHFLRNKINKTDKIINKQEMEANWNRFIFHLFICFFFSLFCIINLILMKQE